MPSAAAATRELDQPAGIDLERWLINLLTRSDQAVTSDKPGFDTAAEKKV